MEINDYARKVLQKRMGEGLLHPGKVSEDITDFKPEKDSPQRAAVVDFLVRPVTVTVHFIKSSQNSREIQEFDRV